MAKSAQETRSRLRTVTVAERAQLILDTGSNLLAEIGKKTPRDIEQLLGSYAVGIRRQIRLAGADHLPDVMRQPVTRRSYSLKTAPLIQTILKFSKPNGATGEVLDSYHAVAYGQRLLSQPNITVQHWVAEMAESDTPETWMSDYNYVTISHRPFSRPRATASYNHSTKSVEASSPLADYRLFRYTESGPYPGVSPNVAAGFEYNIGLLALLAAEHGAKVN